MHSRKDKPDVELGIEVLRNSSFAMLQASRRNYQMTVRFTRVKEGQPPPDLKLAFEVVTIPYMQDERGNTMTSLATRAGAISRDEAPAFRAAAVEAIRKLGPGAGSNKIVVEVRARGVAIGSDPAKRFLKQYASDPRDVICNDENGGYRLALPAPDLS